MTVTAAEQPAILSLEDREDSNYPDLIFPSMIFIAIPSICSPLELDRTGWKARADSSLRPLFL